jgi:trk system potassium uptake protein
VEVSPELSLQEMAVPDGWVGKSLGELDLPTSYGVQVVAVHDMLKDEVTIPPSGHRLTPSDALLVAGKPATLAKLVKLR